jgi:hypothetical protein
MVFENPQDRLIRGTLPKESLVDESVDDESQKITLQRRVKRLEDWRKNVDATLNGYPSQANSAKAKVAEPKRWTARRIGILIIFLIIGIIVLVNLYQVVFLGYTFSF